MTINISDKSEDLYWETIMQLHFVSHLFDTDYGSYNRQEYEILKFSFNVLLNKIKEIEKTVSFKSEEEFEKQRGK